MAAPKGKLVTPVAFDPSGYPLALEVDTDGHLKVVFTSPAKGLVGSHGYVGGAWQKNPILFGYSDRLLININNEALAAGNNALDVDPVPAGWLWVVTNFVIMYAGTSPTCIDVFICNAATYVFLYRQRSPVSWAAYDRQGWWVLKEGDFIRYSVNGATLNDNLYGFANGFKVQLTP